jgi:Ni/Fe-hydrogenase subunit HybB-like protein
MIALLIDAKLYEMLKQVQGFIYPNEIEVHWGILVVVYPYLTGLVAGAFILASLVKVFNVKELQSVYKLSLLTALAFLLIAPLPLLLHLGHPERSYLMVVLLLEIWFTYRRDLILLAREERFPMSWIHRAIALFSQDTSERSVQVDRKAVKAITIIGIPSAFLLHGYVGFIFGSIKANPWWSSVLMPIVFLFSAIVSGIALVILLYMIITPLRGEKIDIKCLDKMASFLFYAVIVDFSIEFLDFIHRLYQSEESIKILSTMVMNKLFISLVIIQVLLGMLVPLAVMVGIRLLKVDEELRKLLYFVSVILIQLGIFATRWNVVIGGQMFSKSFQGLTAYKTELTGIEGLLMTLLLLILPFIILSVLLKIFPAWEPRKPTVADVTGA